MRNCRLAVLFVLLVVFAAIVPAAIAQEGTDVEFTCVVKFSWLGDPSEGLFSYEVNPDSDCSPEVLANSFQRFYQSGHQGLTLTWSQANIDRLVKPAIDMVNDLENPMCAVDFGQFDDGVASYAIDVLNDRCPAEILALAFQRLMGSDVDNVTMFLSQESIDVYLATLNKVVVDVAEQAQLYYEPGMGKLNRLDSSEEFVVLQGRVLDNTYFLIEGRGWIAVENIQGAVDFDVLPILGFFAELVETDGTIGLVPDGQIYVYAYRYLENGNIMLHGSYEMEGFIHYGGFMLEDLKLPEDVGNFEDYLTQFYGSGL